MTTLEQPLRGAPGTGTGEIWRVAGPVVVARGLPGVRLYNVVRVGDAALPGEVIRLDGDRATIQVYEDTAGLRVGEPVRDTGRWRWSSAPACSDTSSTAPSARSRRSPATATTRSDAR